MYPAPFSVSSTNINVSKFSKLMWTCSRIARSSQREAPKGSTWRPLWAHQLHTFTTPSQIKKKHGTTNGHLNLENWNEADWEKESIFFSLFCPRRQSYTSIFSQTGFSFPLSRIVVAPPLSTFKGCSIDKGNLKTYERKKKSPAPCAGWSSYIHISRHRFTLPQRLPRHLCIRTQSSMYLLFWQAATTASVSLFLFFSHTDVRLSLSIFNLVFSLFWVSCEHY